MRNVSQGLEGLLGNASGLGAGGGASGSMSCIQNLLPCKAYLKSSSPPSSCCDPLKEMASNNSQCLCSVLDNPELLKTFNVSQDEALRLPKACGADIDLSKCKDAASPTNSATNSSSDSNNGSSENSSNSSSPESAAANGIPQLSVLLSFVGLYVAFVFSSI
ncbi:Lipid transfer protein [Melia azedarach]|uniref:Lipid transfer protein n=1 Tax=Melia azedarach TaxID=155640 RepID=A0ACC1XPY9_MELAZ|nr:Lipid transfer protein [Melia azedarach]